MHNKIRNTKNKYDIIHIMNNDEQNTGSARYQIISLSTKISNLTEHLKISKKDLSAKHGMIKMISHRNKLLKYLLRKDREQYTSLLKEQGIKHKVAHSKY